MSKSRYLKRRYWRETDPGTRFFWPGDPQGYLARIARLQTFSQSVEQRCLTTATSSSYSWISAF